MTISSLRPLLLLLFLLLLPFLWLGLYAVSPGPPMTADRTVVYIPPRTGLAGIEDILAAKKIIYPGLRFSLLARLTGAAARLKAGEYAFGRGVRPLDVLNILENGKVFFRPVTIPEGADLRQVAGILAAGGWIDYDHCISLARKPQFLAELGIEAQSAEGYLFPDTYYLSKGQQDAAQILKMMIRKHFQVYSNIVQSNSGPPAALGHHAIVTLASIVEKETGDPAERPLIASVFMNRLARNMRLQADPTVRYGLAKDNTPLTRDDLKEPNPYNTYLITGLPPGPICNPGRDALAAALFPAETDYLYFVAKDGSSHYFSKTLREHNEAVSRYRKEK